MSHRTALQLLSVLSPAALLAAPAFAQDPPSVDEMLDRLEALEREQAELRSQIQDERDQRAADTEVSAAETEALLDEIEELRSGAAGADEASRFSIGGYGEHHFTFGDGSGGDVADIHRFVLYLGYEFDDWIQLVSETEIEHAFIESDDDIGGQISIEQLHTELLLSESLNLRVGRVLAPIGIVNERHEPPTFNGVERPNVARNIIPSTWSLDGVGLFGDVSETLSYQTYLSAGLDGSGFSATSGIRGGRIKERPSLNDPALSGRLDWRPLAESESGATHDLRVGGSFYYGGYDNGNRGNDTLGVSGEVGIVSADFQYSVGDFDFRGVAAFGRISDSAALNAALADPTTGITPGIGSRFEGWYVEGAYHLMPEDWKAGKLANSDIVAFLRYEDYDTQADEADGIADVAAASRDEVTVGLGWWLTDRFVIKADYQFLDDDSPTDRRDQLNLGVGWHL